MGNALAACLPEAQDPALRDIPAGAAGVGGGGLPRGHGLGPGGGVGAGGVGAIRLAGPGSRVSEEEDDEDDDDNEEESFSRNGKTPERPSGGSGMSTASSGKPSSINVKRASPPPIPAVAISPPTPTNALVLTKPNDPKKEKVRVLMYCVLSKNVSTISNIRCFRATHSWNCL